MKFDREQDTSFLRGAAKALQVENSRLRAERAELLAQAAELEAKLLAAREDSARLHEDKVRLEQEVRLLQEQLDRRVRELYGRKSERRHSDETAAPGEDPAAAEELAGAEKKKKAPRKPKRGHGPTQQPRLPVVTVVNKLAGDGLICKHCGGTLETLGQEAEEAELIAVEQRKIVLERHLRCKYHCGTCHTGVEVAPGPIKAIPGGRYALSFAVEVAYQKYFAHMPLERQVQMMRHEGLVVTTATLFDQIDALATALAPTYQAIWAEIQKERVLRADETPWDVLSNGHNENKRFYAWVAVGPRSVAFRLLDTRSKEGAAAILGDFSGTLMVDGLTSYPAAAKTPIGEAPRFKVANCNVHARRKFVECEAHYPEESQFALEIYRQIYEVEREGKEPGADLAALRNERSRPLMDKLFTWAREQQARPDLLPRSGLAKALGYLVNHEIGLRVFLDDPAVPADNNESERALRGPIVGRKNYYGSRSARGTEVAAILYTLVESAKIVGAPPSAYLEAAAEHALRKAGAVLRPDEFKSQLDEAAATLSLPPA